MSDASSPSGSHSAASGERPSSASMPPKHPRRTRGVFDARRVRFISFVVITIALFGAALLSILAIWDYTTQDTAWRAVATLGVITGTMLVFTFINEMFGTRMDA